MPAKKTATRKTAAKKATTKKVTTKKAATTKAPAKKAATNVQVTPEDFHKIIQETSYFQAEKAGFSKDPLTYWLEAEQEVVKRLGRRQRLLSAEDANPVRL
jgi:ribosome-binding protein aMBF1 (putative translation factor)